MAEMQELKVGQRVLYHPASSPKSIPPRPCRVLRKLDGSRHAGNKVIVEMAGGTGGEQAVLISSLHVAESYCRECGCIEDWACEGGCSWSSTNEDLCSRCQGIAAVREVDATVANKLLRFKRDLEAAEIPVGIGVTFDRNGGMSRARDVRVVFSL